MLGSGNPTPLDGYAMVVLCSLALVLLAVILTPVTLVAWLWTYSSYRKDKARRAAST